MKAQNYQIHPWINGKRFVKGYTPWNKGAKRTHCANGHEMTPENTLRVKRANICRICNQQACKAYRERRHVGQ